MKNTPLKIFTFIIVTLMAIAAVIAKINPELIPIPKIIEKLYAAINNMIDHPLEKGDDLNLLIILVAIIMPLFAGIMRSISDSGSRAFGSIIAVYFIVTIWVGFLLMISALMLIYIFVKLYILFMAVSYIYCCKIIFNEEFGECDRCDGCDCHECCVGECY